MSDYLEGGSAADRFYRGSYRSLGDFRSKAEELSKRFDSRRREALGRLITPVGPEAAAKLEAVLTSNGFVVTTGQQPGLFGGPLYSLYKALTAVRLAEALEEELGTPVMPLFWVASDDHDWAESNHTWLIDGNNELRELTLGARPNAAEATLSRTPLGSGVNEALKALQEALPDSEFSAPWLERIRSAYSPEATVAAAFRELMGALLEGTPVGMVDAADPALKTAAAPVMEREILTALQGEEVLARRTDELEAEGYAGQVTLMEGGLNLFLENETGRHRLFRGEGGFQVGRGGPSFDQADLLGLLGSQVEDFSPNVHLRPVVESYVFPTLSYVGGPGEIAYLGQLGSFFDHHGVGAPIVTPRASLLIVEPKIDKVLDKFGLTTEDLRDGDRLLTRMARDEVSEEVTRALGGWRGSVGSSSKALTEAVSSIDPTLKGAVANARNSTFAALSDLEKKIVQAVKRESETTVAQIRKAEVNLWPRGRPQDRVLNPFHFLARFGDEFLEAVRREIRVELGVETG